jgi:hypothetical protein
MGYIALMHEDNLYCENLTTYLLALKKLALTIEYIK